MNRLNPTVIALLGIIVLIVAVWVFAGARNADQDKLTGNIVTQQVAGDPEKRCSDQATYDLVKRALFRQAAQQRGGDQAAYDQLASAALLRVEDPAMESQDRDSGAINCSGSLSIDLPPGVTAPGGRTNLMADVDYTIQPASQAGGDMVVLKNADSLVTPLAGLTRTDQAVQAPADQQQQPDQQPATPPDDTTAAPQPTVPLPAPVVAQPAPQPALRSANTRPSFDCSRARNAGEAAVCSDAGLAGLDRSMAAQFGRAMAEADPDQRELLQETGQRFLQYRDHCPTRACMGDAYTGRMREIHDIMAGTWQQR